MNLLLLTVYLTFYGTLAENSEIKELPWLRKVDIQRDRVIIQVSPRSAESRIHYFLVSLWPEDGSVLDDYNNATIHVDPGTFVFYGLDSCRRYKMNLTAVSGEGTSRTIEETFNSWPTTPPTRPTDLKLESGDGYAQFIWSQDPQSAFVASFVVDVEDVSGSSTVSSQSGNMTTFKLEKCGNYTVTVHAANQCGYSEQPPTLPVTIKSPAPSDFKSTLTPTGMVLSWKEPRQTADPYTYMVKLTDSEGGIKTYETPEGQNNISVELRPGQVYEAMVATKTICGLSAPVGPLEVSESTSIYAVRSIIAVTCIAIFWSYAF